MTFRIHARSFSVGVTVCALPLSLYETIKFLRPFPQQARWRAAIAACRRQNVSSVPNVPLQHSPEHLGTGHAGQMVLPGRSLLLFKLKFLSFGKICGLFSNRPTRFIQKKKKKIQNTFCNSKLSHGGFYFSEW